MERRAELILHSEQRLNGSVERFSQRSGGLLCETAEGVVLCYREEDGGPASLRFSGDTVALRRGGGGLLFRQGETCPGQVAVPWGTLALSVRTAYLRHTMTAAGGRALLRYELLAPEGSLGEFVLTIRVRVTDQGDG